MRILKTAAMALALAMSGLAQAATDGTLGATSTATFNASMAVTDPTQPSVQISQLQDWSLGTFTKDELTTAQIGFTDGGYFCVAANNLSAAKIVFDQPNVIFNTDIGAELALVGPIRSGTNSGNAQVPLRLWIATDPSTGSEASVLRNNDYFILGNSLTTEACGGFGTPSYPSGLTKPYIRAQRLGAADALNPAGSYSATIFVTVSPI